MKALAYLDRLAECLARLPGVGRRSAERMAYRLVSAPDRMRDLREALREAEANVRFCTRCGNITTTGDELCHLCTATGRDDGALCVVEDPGDILSIEKSGAFTGRYHALMGRISPMHGTGPGDLRIESLVARVVGGGVQEVILALNTNVESDATAAYIAEVLKPHKTRVTRIAFGLPAGSGIGYSDSVTLTRAVRGRQTM